MAYDAIFTRYSGPTNSRGSRILVKWGNSRGSYPYPSEIGGEENRHQWAANQLRARCAQESESPNGPIYVRPLVTGYDSRTGGYVFAVNLQAE